MKREFLLFLHMPIPKNKQKQKQYLLHTRALFIPILHFGRRVQNKLLYDEIFKAVI